MKRMKVYFNHDGGVDDLVSLLMLLQMPHVDLIGVSVIEADCYLEPAVSATRKIIRAFHHRDISTAVSDSRGKNPFPHEWRMHPYYVDALPMLNEASADMSLSPLPAHRHLIAALREAEEKVTLLFTGPLTDLARALDEDPEIEAKVERLVWMGGSFLRWGNVHEPKHDGTAEWNVYWDPEAAARVWESSIPIVLCPLDATNQLPMTVARREAWAKLRRYPAIDFIGQCYAMTPPLVHFETNSTYYLWDVLATSYLGNPDLVQISDVRCRVLTSGPSQGRTEKCPDGRIVHVMEQVDTEAFFAYMTNLLQTATYRGAAE
ncbi:nucleoside hydrolase [Brevibacillus sp. SYP-B805]|uniref:nucleoside hydrolase n=1 Tax=Brevibacillus sp. SYP-B805 TaxID=1578199 RepID=UPI0013EDA913|nr:nucleoside hydrolase [Brevibacillus sp. SYP-B805]NGQ93775.1 nucleoside hydrolase [Brevibacillus sp. SYP-B805]